MRSKVYWLYLVILACSLCLQPICAQNTDRIDHALLLQAQNYLNNLRNFKADFHQTNPDGSTGLGEFYLRRSPNLSGQLRLLYIKPALLLIVADREKIIYHEDGQPPAVYSLDVTPASALLQAHIDFNNQDITVLSAIRQGIYIMITFAKPGEESSLTLIFTFTPKLRLTGWVVREGDGKQTLVKLTNISTPATLPDALFSIDVD